MVLLRSSGALGSMHVKLANGLTRHNWLANALIGEGLHWDNRIDPRKRVCARIRHSGRITANSYDKIHYRA